MEKSIKTVKTQTRHTNKDIDPERTNLNFRYIKKMEREKVTLVDGTNLYISRANKHRIKEKYSLYILGDCYG